MGTGIRRILFVYPAFEPTFWGLQYSLRIFGKKAAMPPLGLVTIAAMTPPEYECRLVDLNCETLTDGDIDWADMVCFSAMLPQKRRLFETALRCRTAGKTVVFGGPLPTACPEECSRHCDVLVLNEGEITWKAFLDDLKRGAHKSIYATTDKADVTETPVPQFQLLNLDFYACMPIQFSRGCPFECEFCDIIVMFGRRPRTKSPKQVLRELDSLYDVGYRGLINVVDDNFIGNRKEVRKLLSELRLWNEEHGWPFTYSIEASLDLAQDGKLLELMVAAGVRAVFIGIETPSRESLEETKKFQNLRASPIDSVKAIQRAGLMVLGGFIIGFDNDRADIFDRQIDLIREAAIPVATIGLLVALPGTPLYERMKRTERLLEGPKDDVDQCVGYTNVVTVMPRRALLQGYQRVLETIYAPSEFFTRCAEALSRLHRRQSFAGSLRKAVSILKSGFAGVRPLEVIVGFGTMKKGGKGRRNEPKRSVASMWRVFRDAVRVIPSIPLEYRREARRFLWKTLWRCPDQLSRAAANAIIGIHFYRFSRDWAIPRLDMEMKMLEPSATAKDDSSRSFLAQERVPSSDAIVDRCR